MSLEHVGHVVSFWGLVTLWWMGKSILVPQGLSEFF